MKLVPVVLTEEILGDTCDFSIIADGQLDLDSGDINIQSYYALQVDDNEKTTKLPYDLKKHGLPANHKEYLCTSGILKIATKEVDFAVNVNTDDGTYEVSADELEEIKEKALSLASSDAKGKKGKKTKY